MSSNFHGSSYNSDKNELSTVDLFVLASLDQLLLDWNYYLPLHKTTYLNEEVNCTEPSPSVSIQWWRRLTRLQLLQNKLARFNNALIVSVGSNVGRLETVLIYRRAIFWKQFLELGFSIWLVVNAIKLFFIINVLA